MSRLGIRACALAALALSAPMASAQDSQSLDLFKAAEMPGQRMLMRLLDEDGTTLAPFTTDGCSGGMSAGWALVVETFPDLAPAEGTELPWAPCCVTHDRAYHNAGGAETAEDSYQARLTADAALRACVVETGETELDATMARLDLTAEQVQAGYALLAQSMYNAVRLGGGPCSGLPWRWGYGYPNCWALLR